MAHHLIALFQAVGDRAREGLENRISGPGILAGSGTNPRHSQACRGPVTEVKPCHHGPGSFGAKPWDGPPFA
jgi:hypothetical protein